MYLATAKNHNYSLKKIFINQEVKNLSSTFTKMLLQDTFFEDEV